MADTVTAQRRSEIMSKIRAKGMKPEMAVRRMTHAMGYRYRLHGKDLPGKPDLVFPSRRKVIFVHGCFWHQHSDPACRIAHLPKSNRHYWLPKLERNVIRDAEQRAELARLGWDVLVIWECDVVRDDGIADRIRSFLERADG
ncbi:MAG: very short patch repair endonuclease [Gemmatimonadetes bacterium]|nr:very short patch repair endonuclease [Gemmatimonadota bacterium]MXX71150.1 DNA mismatch endonuclease Vsr [Gemmatimonadota bacterium]MYG36129.1 DNA mismatch endonuclease Vsr [Gemmatimonadota bacterium]